MKTFKQLVDTDDPAWPEVQDWVKESGVEVRVLPPDTKNAEKILTSLQVSTRSVLGAVAYETGGILVDSGWLRILGSGNASFGRDLSSWNGLDASGVPRRCEGALLVADDAAGGFFAINAGRLDGEQGNVFYLAPDTLEWEDMDMSYSDFVCWCLTGDLTGFYGSLKWNGWEKELEGLKGDEAISIYPPLFAEGPEIEKRSRKRVPAVEMWDLAQDFRKQLDLE